MVSCVETQQETQPRFQRVEASPQASSFFPFLHFKLTFVINTLIVDFINILSDVLLFLAHIHPLPSLAILPPPTSPLGSPK